jgi:uncharacterized protein (TIGR02597 family)
MTRNSWHTQSGRVTFWAMVLTVSLVLSGAQSHAQEVYTQPVGFYKVPINAGSSATPNLISAPLQRIHDYRGIVSSVTSNTVTVSGSPWTLNQFAQIAVAGTTLTNAQYILVVRKDASTSPGVEGDWWPIISNTANTLTLGVGLEDLSVVLANPDQIEIRHLTTIRDIFGYGSNCVLNADSNFIPSTSAEDIIRYVQGTSFTRQVYYHKDATPANEGYYIDGAGPLDGTTLTIEPDQPLMLFRKAGSTATNAVVLGQVHVTRLSHYLEEGANPVGSPFPAGAPIGTSNLKESGWISDLNFLINTSQEDVARKVTGASLTDQVYHHQDVNPALTGWYVGGVLSNEYALVPGTGYIFYLKPGGGALRWRQAVPYTP